jgi:hypothetical protein
MSEVRFTDAYQQAYVLLLPQRASGRDGPQRTLAVQLHAEGFSGRYAEVGIFTTELRDFVAALEHLERRRAGSAALHSMSPGEFTLAVAAVDRAGHMCVTASLRRLTFVAGELAQLAASVAFELDPSTLPAVVHSCRQLLPAP